MHSSLLYAGTGLLILNFSSLIRFQILNLSGWNKKSTLLTDAAISIYLFCALLLLGWSIPYCFALNYVVAALGFASCLYTFFKKIKSKSAIFISASTSLLLSVNIGCAFFTIKHHDAFFLEKLKIGPPFNMGTDTVFHAALTNMIANTGKITTGLDGTPFTPYHAGSHCIFGQLGKLLSLGSLDLFVFGYAFLVIPLFLKTMLNLVLEISDVLFPAKRVSEISSLLIALSIGSTALAIPSLNERILFFSGPFLGESYGLSLILVFWLSSLILHAHKNYKDQVFESKPAFFFFWFALVPLLFVAITACKFSTIYVVVGIFSLLLVWTKRYQSVPIMLSYAFSTGLSVYTYKQLSFPYQIDLRVLSIFSDLSPLDIFLHGTVFYLPLWLLTAIRFKALKNTTLQSATEFSFLVTIICLVPTLFLNLAGGSVLYFLDPQYWINTAILLAIAIKFSNYSKKNLNRLLLTLLVLQSLACSFYLWKFISQSRNLIAQTSPPANRSIVFQRLDELSKLPWRSRTRTAVFIPQSSKDFWQMLEPIATPFLVPAITGMPMVEGLPPAGFIGTIYYNYANYGYGVRKSTIQDESNATIFRLAEIWGFRNLIRLNGDKLKAEEIKIR